MSVAAVIPGYNEEGTIGMVVEETKKYVDRVFYVDDGSIDDSKKIAEENGASVISYGRNVGKGYAVRVGFRAALKEGYDRIVVLDSDGQHDPAYIPNFLDKLDEFDMVIGSRYAGRFYTIPRNVLGNFGLSFITNFLSYGPHGLLKHKWVADTESGYRAFTREALKKMDLEAREYAIEAETIYEAAVNNLKVKEIPIRIPIRVRGVTIRDGINNALHVFKKRFKL
ncbi:MAG: glycosyltransferase family 2 protein [Candidatus Aenigmatarchaeota archaeon]